MTTLLTDPVLATLAHVAARTIPPTGPRMTPDDIANAERLVDALAAEMPICRADQLLADRDHGHLAAVFLECGLILIEHTRDGWTMHAGLDGSAIIAHPDGTIEQYRERSRVTP